VSSELPLIYRTDWTDELKEALAPQPRAKFWNRWLYAWVRAWASRLLMPAAFWPKEKSYLEARRNRLVQDWNGQKWGIVTPDGVQLDAMFFPARSEPKERATLVYFGGNAESYETNSFVIPMALEELGCNLVTFNYRGVGESEGAISGPSVLIDGYSVLQAIDRYLMPHQNNKALILHGRSIGGAIATRTAAIYQGGQRVSALCNERSFASLELLVSHLVRHQTASHLSLWFLRRSGWHFDSLDLWPRINAAKLIIFHRQDTIVPYPASLHYNLTPPQLSQVTSIELHHTHNIEPHNTPFYTPQGDLYDQHAFARYREALAPYIGGPSATQ
jgi:pimeloyl-ACP methyl ester carboxylesterase